MRFTALRPGGPREIQRLSWVGPAALLTAATAALCLASPSAQHAWVLLVLAPLFEESIFRAGVQDWLSRAARGRWPAIVGTALLFAAAHVLVSGDWIRAAVAVPALAVGVVYARTGRVRDCVVLHAAMNALWLGGLAAI